MTKRFLLCIATAVLLASFAASTQETDPPAIQEQPAEDRAALEADFARLLSGAKLVGSFTDDSRLDQPPQSDSYTIGEVKKLEGDKWRIGARIEYGAKSFEVPVAVEVKWAGRTPVITLDDLVIPLLGTFTARVLFHGDSYAGIWQGPGHGGHMYGKVVRAEAQPASEPPKDGKDERGGREDEKGDDGGERAQSEDTNWPSFRGSSARGWADGYPTPATWDVETGENVRWKTPIAGLAHSSLVIFGDRLFITTAVREGEEAELRVGLYGDPTPLKDEARQDFVLLCLDKRTGEMLWESVAWQGVPKFARHPKSSYAASTPATDGEHVVVNFGTEGLYCFDMEGTLLWKHELGDLDAGPYNMDDVQWGYASSPLIHGDKVIVQCDVLSQGFLAAFDIRTGKELWRTPREEVSTWSSPAVDVREGRAQIICNGWKHMGGYDLETGKELWKLSGGGDAPVPTPIVAHDLIFLTNGHGRMNPIYAIHPDATGEISMQHEKMAWSSDRRGNYMQTPLVYGDELYCCRDNGVLACFDARTGQQHYEQRLGGGDTGFTASMVAADGKLYATGESGEIVVLAAGTSFEHLATEQMGESCMATPAISAGTIYWRTRSQVVAIAAP